MGRSSASLYDHPRSWLDHVLEEDREKVTAHILKMASGDFSDNVFPEYRVKRPDGSVRWILARTFPIRDDEGKVYRIAGIAEDTTVRKRAEEEKRNLEAQVHHAQRLATSGRIVAGIAHEINNPLASIKNSFLLIKDAVPHEHPYFHYVGRIEREIDRMAFIVRQMYHLFSPESSKKVPQNLKSALDDVCEMFEEQMKEKNLRFELDFPDEVPDVFAPKGQIHQILSNLVLNAIEASSPESETIRISLKEEKRDGENLCVQIEDRGEGVSPDILQTIFEPFFTTKGERGEEGMGLGLSVSLSLTRALGGDIQIKSIVGKGSTFTLILPHRVENL